MVIETVAADRNRWGHAVIGQVHADLNRPALAAMSSGKFIAHAAWLLAAVRAFSLTQAAGALAGRFRLSSSRSHRT